jgi:hypothetical protein
MVITQLSTHKSPGFQRKVKVEQSTPLACSEAATEGGTFETAHSALNQTPDPGAGLGPVRSIPMDLRVYQTGYPGTERLVHGQKGSFEGPPFSAASQRRRSSTVLRR